MNIIVTDDKQLAVNLLVRILRGIDPGGTVREALCAERTLELLQEEPADVLFLDIEMPGTNGLELAKSVRETSPGTNVVFVTGHPEYALDAHRLYVSGFLCKPVSEQDVRGALEHLRRPVGREEAQTLRFQCFGNFEVFYHGSPVNFRRSQSKELLAYLVDRRGASCTSGELLGILWEDRPVTLSLKSQLRNLIHDLKRTLDELGAGDVLVRSSGSISVNPEKMSCDYYDFLNCDPVAVNQYRGEYMQQYSWAEFTNVSLGEYGGRR